MMFSLRLSFILVFSFFIVSFFDSIAQGATNSQLASQIEKTLKKYKIDKSELGLWVGNSQSETITSVNATRAFQPASIAKVITAGVVLKLLGPSVKLKSKLVSNSPEKAGKLSGNLYFVGSGDPGFVSEKMWYLVNEFRRNNITEIEGDLVIDDSLFDDVRISSSREDSRVDRAYDAPVGAASFNWNSVNVFVRPTRPGEKAQVTIDPESEYIELVNNAKTTNGGDCQVNVERTRSSKIGDMIRVSGSISKDCPEKVIYKNITNPPIWLGFNLKSFLLQRGIKVGGTVKTGKAPNGARELAFVESEPLRLQVENMMKFSNNYIAEMLTKLLAAQTKSPASLDQGIKVIQSELVQLGFSKAEIRFENPSGLTLENAISPSALGRFLAQTQKDFSTFAEFLSSFPVAGVDGTLKSRLNGFRRQVRAKTGLMKNAGIVSLAGYMKTQSDDELTFVLMYNHRKSISDVSRVWQCFDDIIADILKAS